MKRILVILSVVFWSYGCTHENFREALMAQEAISLTYKGWVQISYDPEQYQLGWNDHKNEYRLCSDKTAYWFTLRCSEKPAAEGQAIKADIAWSGTRSTRSFPAISFTVEKIDQTGLIWLWNESEHIGVIIKDTI